MLFKEWEAYREAQLEYGNGDSWERVLRQGIGLLERLAQDRRIRIRQPQRNLQKKLERLIPDGKQFDDREGDRTTGDPVFQDLQEPTADD